MTDKVTSKLISYTLKINIKIYYINFDQHEVNKTILQISDENGKLYTCHIYWECTKHTVGKQKSMVPIICVHVTSIFGSSDCTEIRKIAGVI